MRSTGKNYLMQLEKTLPNGGYGVRVAAGTKWSAARTGTLNSGNGTTIGFNIRKSNDANITPSNVGTIYIAEAGYDPETEGVPLNVFQGGISPKGDDEYYPVYHLMRFGDDGYGNIQQLKPNGNTSYIGIRCGTDCYGLKPNTQYSYVRVGGDNDIEISYTIGTDKGVVSIEYVNTGLPAIPDNVPTTVNEAQWCKMTASEKFNSQNILLPVDNRALCYDNCTAYATLKAGRYKVVAEAITNNTAWVQTWLMDDTLPYFVLIDEQNNKIINKTEIFSAGLWHHEEYPFILNVDSNVGLFSKVYYKSGDTYFRFMIVDYDEQPTAFDITTQYGQLTGVSCWEAYYKHSGAFVRATKLSEVQFPDSLRSIGEWSFTDTDLKHVILPTYCTYYSTSFPPDCIVEGGIIND